MAYEANETDKMLRCLAGSRIMTFKIGFKEVLTWL